MKGNKIVSILFLGLMLAIVPSITQAKAKNATCQVDEGGKTLYKGACKFEPQGGGSFYISHPNMTQKVKVEGLMVIIESKDYAVVQATKLGGGGSMWGDAVRSQTQKACWVGSSFKICAW